MMRRNWCHVSLAFVLKFLNFLQAFFGVSIILYSLWMLNQWTQHVPQPPLPHNPSPSSPLIALHTLPTLRIADDGALSFDLNSVNLPAPWFIYAFMGFGVLVCCITFLGCVAAEMINGCCLCFYTLLITLILIVEAALVGFTAIDRHWEEDIPFDPTGQLDNLRSFIEDNQDICKWVGITVLVIQALSMLLALILRASISTRDRSSEFDEEDGYGARGRRSWEPLHNHQSSSPSGSGKGDSSVINSDIWSSRMREKYGLNNGEKNSYSQA